MSFESLTKGKENVIVINIVRYHKNFIYIAWPSAIPIFRKNPWPRYIYIISIHIKNYNFTLHQGIYFFLSKLFRQMFVTASNHDSFNIQRKSLFFCLHLSFHELLCGVFVPLKIFADKLIL